MEPVDRLAHELGTQLGWVLSEPPSEDGRLVHAFADLAADVYQPLFETIPRGTELFERLEVVRALELGSPDETGALDMVGARLPKLRDLVPTLQFDASTVFSLNDQFDWMFEYLESHIELDDAVAACGSDERVQAAWYLLTEMVHSVQSNYDFVFFVVWPLSRYDDVDPFQIEVDLYRAGHALVFRDDVAHLVCLHT